MFMCDECSNCVDCNWRFADKLSDINDEARTCPHLIEVAPVIYAHWKPKECFVRDISAKNWYCSNCQTENNRTNYCPQCGAKMDEEALKERQGEQ